MKVSEYSHREMSLLYKKLSELGEHYSKEIADAKLQKNQINQHIFDVLASRNIISYEDIANAIKETLSDIEDSPREILLNVTPAMVNLSNDGFYILNDQKEKVYVDIKFIVFAKDLMNENALPIVLLPKDRYGALITDQKYLSGISDKEQISSDNMKKMSLMIPTKKKEYDFDMIDIVQDAMRQKVSDIHFNYLGGLYYVLFRISGRGVPQHKYTMNESAADDFFNIIRQKMSFDTKMGFKASVYNIPQGGILSYPELEVDLRGQFTPSGLNDQRNKFVCRILEKPTGNLKNINDLKGYDSSFIELLKKATIFPKGLFLVTGVTNSGKSTLTSRFINSIADDKIIATVEDPIEYDKSRVNVTQHQVAKTDNGALNVDFLDYIKSFKRSDLDVVEIGEIRKGQDGNNDLMEAVVEGVKAGNFIIATTHIDSAFDVPLALVNMYDVQRHVVSDLLVFVITQNLVEKLCPHCKIEDTNNENKKKLQEWKDRGDIKYYWTKDLDEFISDETKKSWIRNPDGCPHCNYKGVSGLSPLYEYFKPNVDMIMWLNKHLDHINKFDIEKNFCSRENPYLAKNMLSCYIEKLEAGEVDAHDAVIARALMS